MTLLRKIFPVLFRLGWLITLAAGLLACGAPPAPWNNPYAGGQGATNVFYSSFEDRPKHLDPVRSYSSNEYEFIAQIYEPPLQYHFLKRPYQLVPLTVREVPEPLYLDAAGQPLPAEIPLEKIAFTEYRLRLQPGIHFQPHPAFARDASGEFLYHRLTPDQMVGLNHLSDLPQTATRELTAEDYAYQIKRLAVPNLHSPIAALMGQTIVGLADLSQQLGQHKSTGFLDLRQSPLAGVRVEDRTTYVIRIKGKYPQFLYWLAMPFFAPLPWEADRFYSQAGLSKRNITLDWYPVGTGPFYLEENNPNLRMVLARNPHFHGETYPREGLPEDVAAGLLADAGRPLPFLDRAVFSLEKESSPRWLKFIQGYYDNSGISSDTFDQAVQFSPEGEAGLTEEMRARGIRLSSAVTASVFYLGFNWLDSVVGGDTERARKLRQAIAIAVDFDEYIAIFLNGRGIVAQGAIPPGIFGNREGINPEVFDLINSQPRRKPLAVARQLLAEAGYPEGRDANGQALTLNYDTAASGPDDKARLNWFRKQFAKLGIELVIRSTDYNRFQEKMRTGNAQIYMWGWNADYPDPENFLFLFHGPNRKVGGDGENASNYQNPAFDRLFEQMKNLDNGPERQALIDQMQALLNHDAPWAGGFFPKAFSLHHAWYHNAKPHVMGNNTLKYKRIDPALRVRLQSEWNPPWVWPLVFLGGLMFVALIPAVRAWRHRERALAR
ncbi:ABC transporter substrate-binding protein [Gammaproteobacteria bacterium]